MVSCSIHELSNNEQGSSRYKGSATEAAAPCNSNAGHQDYYTDRELILTLHSHFRKKQMSNLQGFYLMDADADQIIGVKDIVQIFKDSGLVISLDRVKSLIRGFAKEQQQEEEMNVHGYLRFMASAYAQRYDDQL